MIPMKDDLEQARPGKQQKQTSQSGDSVETHAQGASIVQIETVGKGLMVLVISMLSISLIASIAALVIAVFAESEAYRAYDKAEKSERESRLAQPLSALSDSGTASAHLVPFGEDTRLGLGRYLGVECKCQV